MSVSQAELTIDDYQLLNCIASGSSSQVWEIGSSGDAQHYAMKLLLPEAFSDPEQVKTLRHEGKVGKSLEHPNIIPFHKVVANKQHAYIVMDYFRAPNVKVQISSDQLGLHVRIRKLVEGLCLSLGHMHEKGWIHRDIKPENVLFSKSSELRLIDFSLSAPLAKGIGKMFAGKIKVVQGTRTYIAPETIKKEQPTEQTDMYSLGITLFEILVGQPPFRGSSPTDLLKKHVGAIVPNPSSFQPNLTPELDKFILRLLAKKPANRHKSMDEVFAEFRSIKAFKEDPQELADKLEKERAERDAQTFDGQRTRLSSRLDAGRTETGRSEAAEATPAAPAKPAAPAAATTPAPLAAAGARPPSTMPVPAQPAAGQGGPAVRPAAMPPSGPPVAQPGMPLPGGPVAAMPPGYPPGYAPPGYAPPGYAQPGYPPGYGVPPGVPGGYPNPANPPQGAPPQGLPPGYAMPGYPPGYGVPGGPGVPQGMPPQPRPMMPPGAPQPGVMPPGGPQPMGARPGAPAGPQPMTAAPRPAPAPMQPAARPAPTPARPAAAAQAENADDLPLMEELPPIL